MKEQFVKTKICPYLRKGHCNNGTRCLYAHSTAELKPFPDLRKTKLCDSITKGVRCANQQCRYAHCREELRATDDLVAYKAAPCFFHLRGKCLNGDKCRFAHGHHELRGNLYSNGTLVRKQRTKSLQDVIGDSVIDPSYPLYGNGEYDNWDDVNRRQSEFTTYKSSGCFNEPFEGMAQRRSSSPGCPKQINTSQNLMFYDTVHCLGMDRRQSVPYSYQPNYKDTQAIIPHVEYVTNDSTTNFEGYGIDNKNHSVLQNKTENGLKEEQIELKPQASISLPVAQDTQYIRMNGNAYGSTTYLVPVSNCSQESICNVQNFSGYYPGVFDQSLATCGMNYAVHDQNKDAMYLAFVPVSIAQVGFNPVHMISETLPTGISARATCSEQPQETLVTTALDRTNA